MYYIVYCHKLNTGSIRETLYIIVINLIINLIVVQFEKPCTIQYSLKLNSGSIRETLYYIVYCHKRYTSLIRETLYCIVINLIVVQFEKPCTI